MVRLAGCSVFLLLGGCSDDGSDGDPCFADTSCSSTEVCWESTCQNPARLDCVLGAAETAALLPSAVDLSFGEASTEPVLRSVQLQSAGSCSLEVFSVRLEKGAPYRCLGCSADQFPTRILPGRSVTVEVVLDPGPAGTPVDALVIESNDPDLPVLTIPLLARAAGVPVASIDPGRLDFGFVPASERATRVVQVVNAVQGAAVLTVEAVRIEPAGTAFSARVARSLPAELSPTLIDPGARLAIDVDFAPEARRNHAAELVIESGNVAQVRVPLSGSEHPPIIGITPRGDLDFGTVRLGDTKTLSLNVQNTGRAPLVVQAEFAGQNSDLEIRTTLKDPVPPGALRTLEVRYAPTAPQTLNDTLQLRTNDPSVRSFMVGVRGQTAPEPVDVVSIELRFDGGRDTPLDADLRDVDLILESPDGRICRAAQSSADWGRLGSCRWSGFGPEENPERIVLKDVMEDGRYPVLLTYEEDCSSLPTALTAMLLGIGTDELLDAITEDDVMLPPGALETAIQQACLSRTAASGTVIITRNGQLLGSQPVNLAEKGDRVTALTLVRGPEGSRLE